MSDFDHSYLLLGTIPVTPQEISDFSYQQRRKREQLTLTHQPLATLATFLQGIAYLVYESAKYIVLHRLFLFVFVPVFCLYAILDRIPGLYTDTINDMEFAVEFAIWWVGLGVLSSVGLGSGLQSGVLFLFPHIFKVCLAARTCNTLDFESYSDIWFRSPENLFQCPELTSNSTPVTFFGIWKKVILVCFLQSAGTALGEIPPYWMTRSARLAALEAGNGRLGVDVDMPEELESSSRFNIINRLKGFMIWFLQQYGFYGVLIMASYPNLAFDLCGMCCGHFLMPFWSFFIATLIGKAIIRNAYQSFFYVLLCSEEYLEMIIRILQRLSPDHLDMDTAIREVLEQGRESFQRKIPHRSTTQEPVIIPAEAAAVGTGSSNISEQVFFAWQLFMAAVLVTFALSCFSEFAQYYQRVLDSKVIDKLKLRLPESVLKEILSPSGRMHLPPPRSSKRSRLYQSSLSSVSREEEVFSRQGSFEASSAEVAEGEVPEICLPISPSSDSNNSN